MKVEFNLPLAQSDQFSNVIYGATPQFKLKELAWQSQYHDSIDLTYTQSGRAALAIAGLQLKKLNSIILVPSYHCPAAIEPFIWLNYRCVFYRINADLSPDMAHIEQLLAQHNITHTLIINYFGVACYFSSLITMMQQRSITVIYDCAHALFKILDASEQIQQADATICSINKLLPAIDGGLLHLKHHEPQRLTKVPAWSELKAISYVLGITQFINKARGYFKTAQAAQIENDAQVTNKFRYFSPQHIEQSCYSHTIFMLSHSKLAQVKQRRRDNYFYLANQLKDTHAGEVLFEKIADDAVPYVLPYLLHNDQGFITLRQAGVQNLRWEEAAITDCEITNKYRHRLVQLPCHHLLTTRDLDAIAQIVKDI